MSYAKKAKKGYYGIAEFKDKDGKRHQKSAGCFRLKREALQAGDELERELNKVNLDLRDVTLFDYFKRWFDLYMGTDKRTLAADLYFLSSRGNKKAAISDDTTVFMLHPQLFLKKK